MHPRRHPALPQRGLQPRDLVQARRLLDHVLQPLLLLVGQLYARHACRQARAADAAAVRGEPRLERLGLDPHDLGREVRRLLGRAEELGRLLPLGVFDLGEVEESDGWAAPKDPVAVVL